MQPRNHLRVPGHSEVIDSATLFLCRQGTGWVVVIEAPRLSGAVRLRRAGRDSQDAQSELLALARKACPDATIMSTDGALTSEDYEWRVDVRGVEARSGDLGMALQRLLSADGADDDAGGGVASLPLLGRRCHWGLSSSASGRPRSF
jgi:hypothetical protein